MPLALRHNAGVLSLVVVAAGIALWLACSPLGAHDLVGGDEGYYGTMARNILADPRYLVSPSLTPLGTPGDKPPLYPALLALSVRAFGPGEPALRWLSLLAAGVIALGVGRLVQRASGGLWGVFGAATLISLPWFADASRAAAAEPWLTALGVLALVCVSGGPTTSRRATLAGALLGLAFLCKLWLIALIAIPVASVWLPLDRARARSLAVLIGSAIAVAAAQLVAVACFAPGQLPHWRAVYLGAALGERLAGPGYASFWLKPPIYYWALLTHAFALALPLIAIGAAACWRRRREPLPRALGLWAAGGLLLSGFAVKSGQYAYVVVPAWAALAALGGAETVRQPRVPWPALAVPCWPRGPLGVP